MKCITSKIDLQHDPHKIRRPGDAYYPPSTGVTTSSYQFQFQWEHSKIVWACWRMCWAVTSPTGQYNVGRYLNRLVHCDNGPANKVAFAWINSDENPPQNQIHNRAENITSQMEALRCAGEFKNVIWEIAGDNTNDAQIFACWIEIVWDTDQWPFDIEV
jgi:hypothetical protein